MKKLIALIALLIGLGIGQTAMAGTQCLKLTFGSATLSWTPPTENTDGSVLTDLAGYKIYYGTEAGNYTSSITLDNPDAASYVVESLPAGNTYYFVITAFTFVDLESEYSTMGSKVISNPIVFVIPCPPQDAVVVSEPVGDAPAQ